MVVTYCCYLLLLLTVAIYGVVVVLDAVAFAVAAPRSAGAHSDHRSVWRRPAQRMPASAVVLVAAEAAVAPSTPVVVCRYWAIGRGRGGKEGMLAVHLLYITCVCTRFFIFL